MKTGRPSKPTALKIIAGNPGKRRLNEREPDPGMMDLSAPAELSAEAVPHWDRLVPMLVKTGVLKKSDRDILALYCEGYVAHLAAVRAGKINVGLMGQLRQMLGEMGMTPATRARIVADKPQGDETEAKYFGTA
jgi:phage terminase small subunit